MPNIITSSGVAEIFGARLTASRRELGYNQKFIAEKAGVNPSVLCRLERGQSAPTLTSFVRIITLFPQSADWFLGMREVRNPNNSESHEVLINGELYVPLSIANEE